MKIDIGSNLRHFFSNTKVDLPKSTEPFFEVFSFEGKATLISAFIAFNRDDIQFKVAMDDVELTDIDLSDFTSIFNFSGEDDTIMKHPFSMDKSKNVLKIDFGAPVEFYTNFKLYARANSNSSSRDLKGYSIFLGNVL